MTERKAIQMLKMLMLLALVQSNGHTVGFQKVVLVRNPEECRLLGEQVLAEQSVQASMKRNEIIMSKVFCTDPVKELDFWPIPDKKHVPIPTRSPIYDTI